MPRLAERSSRTDILTYTVSHSHPRAGAHIHTLTHTGARASRGLAYRLAELCKGCRPSPPLHTSARRGPLPPTCHAHDRFLAAHTHTPNSTLRGAGAGAGSRQMSTKIKGIRAGWRGGVVVSLRPYTASPTHSGSHMLTHTRARTHTYTYTHRGRQAHQQRGSFKFHDYQPNCISIQKQRRGAMNYTSTPTQHAP